MDPRFAELERRLAALEAKVEALRRALPAAGATAALAEATKEDKERLARRRTEEPPGR